MKTFATITTLLLLPAAVIGSAQVNFYWDANCQNYAGTSFAELGGPAVGGPAGAESMLFVNSDECFDTCGPNLKFCKNPECNAWDLATTFGECKHFRNGVWAAEDCGCE